MVYNIVGDFMKANFIKRFLAYMVDAIVVSLIFSIITMGIDNTKVDILNDQLLDVEKSYINQEIGPMDAIDEMASIYYDMESSRVVTNVIYTLLLIGYFIVFQYMNKGQTLGKKLLKIRVVENNDNPSLLAMIIRTLFINQIFVNIILILLVFVIKDSKFFMVCELLSLLNTLFVFISCIMILYRKDKLGLHDMLSKTSVVEV